MSVLFGLLWPLERFNTVVLAVGRIIAVIALAIMVALILGQVFFRYVLSDAPNWTEEGARFGMLWMTGLMAPLAFRMGGFVSID
ncbi:MAG: TRAP-type C4-dicarboxylate transport system permease small subunit, partial [Yoonia sp.]